MPPDTKRLVPVYGFSPIPSGFETYEAFPAGAIKVFPLNPGNSSLVMVNPATVAASAWTLSRSPPAPNSGI